MINLTKTSKFIYLIGDLVFLYFALWLALLLRHLSFPSPETLQQHLFPFSFLFVVWIFVFYIAGLYDAPTVSFRKKLPKLIFKTQIINSVIGVFFFYLFSGFDIAPKTNLILYLFVSFVLILSWRLFLNRKLRSFRKQKAVVLGKTKEVLELYRELKENPVYDFEIDKRINFSEIETIDFKKEKISVVIVDFNDEESKTISPFLYKLTFIGVSVISFERLYEDIFEKVPLSSLNNEWFLENIPLYSRVTYDPIKRFFDISISLVLGLFSLFVYPFIWLAVLIEDRGKFLIVQDRIGINGKTIKTYKIRSMKNSDRGTWVKDQDERITKVGSFIRKLRIDELPQLYNVLKGDISLIGPRPDIIGIKEQAEKEIPYYETRTIVRPGMSGWAQVNQEKPPQSIEETKERLSYDLYYIKNRSLFLDFKIALKTIRILIKGTGR